MTKEIKIQLNEEELAKILAIYFNLDEKSAKLNVYKYNADDRDPRDQSYTTITFTSKEK